MNADNRALETANILVLGLSLRRHSVISLLPASVFITTEVIPTYTSGATFVAISNNKTQTVTDEHTYTQTNQCSLSPHLRGMYESLSSHKLIVSGLQAD